MEKRFISFHYFLGLSRKTITVVVTKIAFDKTRQFEENSIKNYPFDQKFYSTFYGNNCHNYNLKANNNNNGKIKLLLIEFWIDFPYYPYFMFMYLLWRCDISQIVQIVSNWTKAGQNLCKWCDNQVLHVAPERTNYKLSILV